MFLQILLCFALLNLVYLFAFFTISIWLNVAETHYFLGYGKKFLKFTVRRTTFHIGVYIPIVMLSPIYTITNDEKRMKYPWEFFEKSLFRRFVATLGGVIGFLILFILIFTGRTYFNPDQIISKEEINKHGIEPSESAIQSGFQSGDKILALNGEDFESFDDLFSPDLLGAPETSYTVLRDGREIEIKVENLGEKINRSRETFIFLRMPSEVKEVRPDSPADRAGLKSGDKIVKVDSVPVATIQETTTALKSNDNPDISLLIERKQNDTIQTLELEVQPDYERVIGVRWNYQIQYTAKKHSLLESLWIGPSRAFSSIKSNVIAFYRIFSGDLSRKGSVSGPIGIAEASKFSAWTSVWTFLSAYGLTYILYNFLPLPRSVFWELLALAYEGVTRRKYPYKFFKRSWTFSWVIFGGYILVIFILDLMRLFY